MITTRESVRAAVQRAMALEPDEAAAVAAVAQALALPVEAVREALEPAEQAPA